MNRWKTSKTAVFNLSYHLIWCPKYRRKVLVGDIKDRLIELIYQKAEELELEVVEANIRHNVIAPLKEKSVMMISNKKRLTPKTEYRKISKKTRDQSPKKQE